jgi:leucyl-tRNA synthetase
LRDWGVSRQRFWGAPIPIIYCEDCGVVPEKYENLPDELPETAPFTGTGESPLAKVPEFLETSCPACGKSAKRETDTMDTFVDSSWYYFRYLDPHNADAPFANEKAAYWTPVDQYVGGDDHAVMHLIYTRFWAKMMRDIGLVTFDEPIRRLLTQGMVVGETFFDDASGKRKYYAPAEVEIERDAKGKITKAAAKDGTTLKHAVERMSKSKGNGVDPDEMVDIYGADAARLFVLFAAPVDNELVWNESGIEGAVRFLQRLWRIVWNRRDVLSGEYSFKGEIRSARALRRKTHQTIHRVDAALDSLQFNTPISGLMELLNAVYDADANFSDHEDEKFALKEALAAIVVMLTPFAPHTAESLYSEISGNADGIVRNDVSFPQFDAEIAREEEIEIPIQINGKLRSRISASPDTPAADLESMALADEKAKEYTDGKQVVKVIVVPGRLVNVVVK